MLYGGWEGRDDNITEGGVAAFSGAGLPASPGRLFVVDGEGLSVFGDCFPGFGDGAARTARQASTPLCDLGEGQLSRLDPPLAGVVA